MFGKIVKEERVKGYGEDKIDELYCIYEAYLSNRMVDSLGKNCIDLYACIVAKMINIDNTKSLSEDLEKDPFLHSAICSFICNLYFDYGKYLAPFTAAIITAKHYDPEGCKEVIDSEEKRGQTTSEVDM